MTIHHMTNSERSRYEACRHRHFIEYVLGARMPRFVKALEYGRIIHLALETWWDRHGRWRLDYTEEILCEQFMTLEKTIQADGSWLDRDALRADFGLLVAMMRGYHEQYKLQSLRMLMNERVLSARVRTSTGHRSNVTGIACKLDKLVVDEMCDELWLMDHKTSSRSLDQWRRQHEYVPQALQYAVLLREHDIKVEGVIYDLLLKAQPPTIESFRVVKAGTRLHSTLPANATVETFDAALAHHDFDPESLLHRNQRAKLSERTHDPFFRREWIEFTDYDLDRARDEIYTVATQVRRAHDSCEKEKAQLVASSSKRSWRQGVVDAVHSRGGEFPRSSQACHNYGRRCPLMTFCAEPCMETAEMLEPWERDYTTELGLVASTRPGGF